LRQKASHNKKAIIATSTAKDLPHDYYQFITIFARASPHDKEVIVKYFK
jgi:magnesium-transporting ATPase (P-type)